MIMNKKVTTETGMCERVDQLNTLLLAQDAGLTLEYTQGWRNNTELEGYILQSPEKNCSPLIYYNSNWYDKSDEEVVQFLIQMNKEHAHNIDTSCFTDKEYILSNIYPKLVSASNEDKIKEQGIAYINYQDMLVLFYVNIEEIKLEEGEASIKVTNRILKMSGISIDEAYAASIQNMESQIEIHSIHEMLLELNADVIPEGSQMIPMFICTNKRMINGASAILCPSLLHTLERMFGEHVAILPSSIHECIAVPYDDETDFQFLRSTVCEINATEVLPEDKLTDSVYSIRNHELCKVS